MPGQHFRAGAIGEREPTHDVHLPQLHRRAAFPAFPLARTPIPQRSGRSSRPATAPDTPPIPRAPATPRVWPAQTPTAADPNTAASAAAPTTPPPPPPASDADTTPADATDPPAPPGPRPHSGPTRRAASAATPPTSRPPRYRQPIADHRQHGLIPLLGHAQLPHLGSVKDQPK